MFKCTKCDNNFFEPNRKKMSYEDYYGVSDLFGNYNYTELEVCPECGDEDLEELGACAICQEWFEKDELIDTDGMINGSVGYVCEQCLQDNDIK